MSDMVKHIVFNFRLVNMSTLKVFRWFTFRIVVVNYGQFAGPGLPIGHWPRAQ